LLVSLCVLDVRVVLLVFFFFFQAEDGIRDSSVTGVQTCALPILARSSDASAPEERATLEEVRAWAAEDPAGDLDRFPASDAEAFRRLRGRVAADADGCRMATCGRARECFWVRARRRAGEAKLVIVNHA